MAVLLALTLSIECNAWKWSLQHTQYGWHITEYIISKTIESITSLTNKRRKAIRSRASLLDRMATVPLTIRLHNLQSPISSRSDCWQLQCCATTCHYVSIGQGEYDLREKLASNEAAFLLQFCSHEFMTTLNLTQESSASVQQTHLNVH